MQVMKHVYFRFIGDCILSGLRIRIRQRKYIFCCKESLKCRSNITCIFSHTLCKKNQFVCSLVTRDVFFKIVKYYDKPEKT